MSSSKEQVVVMVDRRLMERVDALTGDRDGAVEAALALWCQQQLPGQAPREPQIRTPADYHRHRHNQDETGWLV